MKLSKSLAVRVVKPRGDVADVRLMREILGSLERGVKTEDGYYNSARFALDGRLYLMDGIGNLYIWVDSLNRFKQKKVSFCKGGLYPMVTLRARGEYTPIMAYKLSLLCLTDWFFDKYVEDDGLVVNHCIVEKHQSWVYDRYYDTRPVRGMSYNPRALELVTYSQNRQISRYTAELHLYGVYVSAEDMVDLYRYICEKRESGCSISNRDLAVKFYENKWRKDYSLYLGGEYNVG